MTSIAPCRVSNVGLINFSTIRTQYLVPVNPSLRTILREQVNAKLKAKHSEPCIAWRLAMAFLRSISGSIIREASLEWLIIGQKGEGEHAFRVKWTWCDLTTTPSNPEPTIFRVRRMRTEFRRQGLPLNKCYDATFVDDEQWAHDDVDRSPYTW